MNQLLESYAKVAGEQKIEYLRQMAGPFQGFRLVHVNSTRYGGGVAEILDKFVPLQRALGIDAEWLVMEGSEDFYRCTKMFHNALQGHRVEVPENLSAEYERVNAVNAEIFRDKLQDADMVVIHDPQPAALIRHFPDRRGKWVWRCHIDVSKPFRKIWKYLQKWLNTYDASIFSLAGFAQPLPHTQFLIHPCIDPLSEKNMPLPDKEVAAVRERYGLDPYRPVVAQISRFDRFKDPVGVIHAYRLAKKAVPLQLVLAGGGADDDPEGALVLEEVRKAAAGDADVKIIPLAQDNRAVNALQRCADIVLQKSLKEGFGLTVTEAMWKKKPVIGGNTGGIRLQVFNNFTGYLVNSPEGTANRISQLLRRRDKLLEFGQNARHLVRERFLITRSAGEYLALMIGQFKGRADVSEVLV